MIDINGGVQVRGYTVEVRATDPDGMPEAAVAYTTRTPTTSW